MDFFSYKRQEKINKLIKTLNDSNLKKKLELLNDLEANKKYKTNNPGNLHGIDKIIIINLKGSIRESAIRNQLNKLGNLIEGKDYEFIRPINFRIDNYTIEKLFEEKLFDKEFLDDFISSDNNLLIGTISLSLITYYIYLKAYLENKIFLILEDNIEFERKFVSNYNLFYDNLPTKNWWCLDIHTTNNHGYHDEYFNYYSKLNDKLKLNFEIPQYKKDTIINWRPKINTYCSLGCYEDGGAKGYIIKPLSFLFINKLPIIFPADGIKAEISGWWNLGLSYLPNFQLIRYTDKYSNDRRNIDKNIITNEYQKLDQNYINNIIDTVKKFNDYQIYELNKIIN
jgi:hypothetical protein